MSAKCKSCGAAIEWTLTTAGKRYPVDAKPDRATGTLLVRGGYCRRLEEPELTAARNAGTLLYVPHWATCPDAKSWRRG